MTVFRPRVFRAKEDGTTAVEFRYGGFYEIVWMGNGWIHGRYVSEEFLLQIRALTFVELKEAPPQ